jgi:NADH-quinone oxidoreductase subunit M
MMWLGLATAVYGALMALRATDGKKLLAFSSMSHLGIAVAGVFSLSEAMLPAVLVLLVAHGLCAGAQFFLMGIAERMAGTRELDKLGGLSGNSPVFSTLFGALGVMSLAVPGTAGFVGEFTVLLSLWDMGPFAALVMGFSMILSAAYMLRFIQKVIFGKASGNYDNGPRTSGLEGASIGIMAVLLLVFGFHPAFVTDSLHLFDEETVEQMNDAGKAADGEEAAETDEDGDEEELPQAMTPDEIAQLDSSLKANGFSDEERKSLITQVVGAEAALALESRVQAGLDAEASDDAKTNDEALNKEASND